MMRTIDFKVPIEIKDAEFRKILDRALDMPEDKVEYAFYGSNDTITVELVDEYNSTAHADIEVTKDGKITQLNLANHGDNVFEDTLITRLYDSNNTPEMYIDILNEMCATKKVQDIFGAIVNTFEEM